MDSFVFEKKFADSRNQAKALIMAGKVLVNDEPCDKPGVLINYDAKVIVKKSDNPFVSQGGLKLDNAFKKIPFCPKGLTCLDIGASTGGFTDCLIQNGALKAYAVDVGYGQFDWTLRQNTKIKVIERTNIRYMPYETINEKVDLITIDTSFISLKTIVLSAKKFMKEKTKILALIKPQFEAGKENVGKGGIVRDPKIINQVIKDLKLFFKTNGYRTNKVVPCPVLDPKKNQEYIIYLEY